MEKSIKAGVIALTLISLLCNYAKAQTTDKTETYGSGIRLSISADGGIPVGTLKNGFGWDLGGSLQADFPIIKDQFYATINSGYNDFFSKNGSNLPNLNMIPIKGGLKYFPLKNFYIQGEAGASFVTNKNDFGFNNSAVFVYAPQVGVLFGLGGKNFIDAGFRFEGNSKFTDPGNTNNFLTLRVAYSFGL
jgi:hypothetical protein